MQVFQLNETISEKYSAIVRCVRGDVRVTKITDAPKVLFCQI